MDHGQAQPWQWYRGGQAANLCQRTVTRERATGSWASDQDKERSHPIYAKQAPPQGTSDSKNDLLRQAKRSGVNHSNQDNHSTPQHDAGQQWPRGSAVGRILLSLILPLYLFSPFPPLPHSPLTVTPLEITLSPLAVPRVPLASLQH